PAAALLVALLAGCKGEEVFVHVDCVTTAAPAIECEVKQTKGKSEVEVCWDFSVTCGNGAVVKAPNTCQKVKDGGTVKTTISADKLDGIDQCGGDKPPTGSLTNMTINGKASTK
ncbi:MAG TPA: hypothetical protein VIV40_43100, partial [Kofleriaceae bacterium]